MTMYFKFSQNFLSKTQIFFFLIDNHYKTIFEWVRSAWQFEHVVYKLELFVLNLILSDLSYLC